jgi:hypothetical protein
VGSATRIPNYVPVGVAQLISMYAKPRGAIVALLPVVLAITPATGPTAGGTLVRITGYNFDNVGSVTIGGAACTSVIVGGGIITCFSPAGTAGAKDVVVTGPAGAATLSGAFTYVAAFTAPTISSLNYSQGDVLGGGQSIVITGTNLSGATGVSFGGTAATITGNTSTTVTVTLPPKVAGVTTVAVTTSGGTSGTLAFEYWSLASVPTPQSMYRADLGVTNVSGKASQWNDQSGAADVNRNLAQATAGNRPTINATDANFGNQSSLAFSSAATTYMQTSGTFTGSPYAQPLLIFFVARWNTVGGHFLLDDNGTGSRIILGESGGGLVFNAGVGLTGGTLTTGVTHAGILYANGAGSLIYLDGSAASVVSGNAGTNALKGLTVGCDGGFSVPFDGWLAELTYHQAADSLSTRQKFMKYCNQRYGTAFT